MPVSMMLDAGHGGRDPGAVYNGRQEKEDTLRLTLLVGELLQEQGVDVEYTRTTDIYESPYQKAREANEADVDYFLSIHRNSFPVDNQVSGALALVYQKEGIKYEMAQEIVEQLETVGFVDLGVDARPDLVVLQRTRMPAILLEVGFINSDTDNLLFDENFEEIARAIADGVLDTLRRNGQLPEVTPIPLRYAVQTGAFRNQMYAERLLEELKEQNFPAEIQENDGYYRVVVGEYSELSDAISMEQQLRRAGYQTVIITA